MKLNGKTNELNMSGLLNTNNKGLYISLEPVQIVGIGTTLAAQAGCTMQQCVFFEGDEVDSRETMHPMTLSLPGLPGVITGTASMPAQAAIDSSSVFSINNQSVSNSGTKKLHNFGNAPITPMGLASGHSVRFYIAK